MLKHIIKKNLFAELCSLESCLELLRAMSDRTRQEIISIFVGVKEACANDIARNFSLSRPTISHHLNLMKRAGLLNSRKEGKEVFYSFNKPYVTQFLERILSALKKC